MKPRRIVTMTPNKLAIYFVADMVVADIDFPCGRYGFLLWPISSCCGRYGRTPFRPPLATVVFAEPFSHGTGTLWCLQKEMATYRHWSVLVARLRQCLTLSNPVPWQNWMAAYLGYTLWMKMLFRGWPVMVHDTHTRRRRIHGSVRPVQIWPQPGPRPRGSGLGLSFKHLASFDIPGLQQQPVRSTENRQNWIAR